MGEETPSWDRSARLAAACAASAELQNEATRLCRQAAEAIRWVREGWAYRTLLRRLVARRALRPTRQQG